MRLQFTGRAGFIASNLAKLGRASDVGVTILHDLSTGGRENLQDLLASHAANATGALTVLARLDKRAGHVALAPDPCAGRGRYLRAVGRDQELLQRRGAGSVGCLSGQRATLLNDVIGYPILRHSAYQCLRARRR
jgi:hypothetical protein